MYHLKLIKQTPFRLYGQVYLHVVSDLLARKIIQINPQYLEGLDGEIIADNYDGIVVFDIKTDIPDLVSVIDNLSISDSDIVSVVTRMSCDKRSEANFSCEEITDAIQKIHNHQWLSENITEKISKPSTSMRKAPFLNFAKKTPDKFEIMNVFYEYSSADPRLRLLSVQMIKTLSLAFGFYLYSEKDWSCYEDVPYFADYQIYQKLVGFQQRFVFEKSQCSTEQDFQKYLNYKISTIKSYNFVEKFSDKLAKRSSLLCDEILFSASGFLPLNNFWQTIELDEILTVLGEIELSCSVETLPQDD